MALTRPAFSSSSFHMMAAADVLVRTADRLLAGLTPGVSRNPRDRDVMMCVCVDVAM